MTTTSGGDGGVRPCAWERDREEEEHGESERGPEGLRGALSQLQAVGGKQELASYGHARVGTRSASDLREVEDDWHLPGGLGRLEELGQVSGPGRFPFSLFFYLFLFSNIL